MQCPGNITDLCLPKAGQVFIVQRSRLANEVETVEVETVKACPWSSYGITQGSHGLRLLGINPSLTRAQLCAFRDLQLTATNPTVIYILRAHTEKQNQMQEDVWIGLQFEGKYSLMQAIYTS